MARWKSRLAIGRKPTVRPPHLSTHRCWKASIPQRRIEVENALLILFSLIPASDSFKVVIQSPGPGSWARTAWEKRVSCLAQQTCSLLTATLHSANLHMQVTCYAPQNRKFISHRADSALTMNYFRNKQSLWELIFPLWNSHGKGTILLWKIVSLSGLSRLYVLINEDCMCQLAKQCYRIQEKFAFSFCLIVQRVTFCEPSITKMKLHLLLVETFCNTCSLKELCWCLSFQI